VRAIVIETWLAPYRRPPPFVRQSRGGTATPIVTQIGIGVEIESEIWIAIEIRGANATPSASAIQIVDVETSP